MNKLMELLPTKDELKLVQGIEAELLQRKQTSNISGAIALAAAIIQIVLAALNRETYLEQLGRFVYRLVQWLSGRIPLNELFEAEGIPIYQLIGLLVIIVAAVSYLLFKWTGFLFEESEKPFRYTFSIEPFKQACEDSNKRAVLLEQDRFQLLHYDLIERINQRFKDRFSFLNENTESKELSLGKSHFHIRGDYAIREDHDGRWCVHVTPFVRIGAPDQPEVVIDPPIEILINGTKSPNNESKSRTSGNLGSEPACVKPIEHSLDSDNYNWLVEQVYSRIATEIYRQIEIDLQDKVRQFPTDYLRAVALSVEAEDFARSNTIDAYERAVALYRQARQYIRRADWRALTQRLIGFPLVWRLREKHVTRQAKIEIGFARVRVYQRLISLVTGRKKIPIFDILPSLEETISDLEELYKRITNIPKVKPEETAFQNLVFPDDLHNRDLFKVNEATFRERSKTLFDAYTVAALSLSALDATNKASGYLEKARAVAPQLSESNALYKMVQALCEAEIEKRVRLLRQATESAERFEFAQFELAFWAQNQFLAEGELSDARAKIVLDEYEKVLRINPGNIAALAAQGYLYWLLGEENNNIAEDKFNAGLKISAIVHETFVGVLKYGLARVAAEKGQIAKSFNAYRQAISADPGVAACNPILKTGGSTFSFDYISPAILERYQKFSGTVKKNMETEQTPAPEDGTPTESMESAVYSYALNDYGNACLNFYWRFGDREKLDEAVRQFGIALEKNPDSAVAWYDKMVAFDWQRNRDEVQKCIPEVRNRLSGWQPAVIANIRINLMYQMRQIPEKPVEETETLEEPGKPLLIGLPDEIKKEIDSANKKEDELKRLEEEKKALPARLEDARRNRSNLESLEVLMKSLPQSPLETPERIGYQLKQKIKEEKSTGKTQLSQSNMEEEIKNIDQKIKTIDDTIRDIEKQINTIDHAIGIKRMEEEELRNKANELQRKWFDKERDKLIHEAVRSIAQETKLSTILNNYWMDSKGSGVNEFLGTRNIRWEQLDEDDVLVLKTWAEFLAINNKQQEALESSQVLCEHILKWYFLEDFNACIQAREVITDWLKMIGGDLAQEWNTPEAKPIIKNWQDEWKRLAEERNKSIEGSKKNLTSLDIEHFKWSALGTDQTFRNWAKSVLIQEDYELMLAQVEGHVAQNLIKGIHLGASPEPSSTASGGVLNPNGIKKYSLYTVEHIQARDTLRRWSKLIGQALDKEIDKVKYDTVVRNQIETWLINDPTHYLALRWCSRIFSLAKYEEKLNQVCKLEETCAVLRKSLAKTYLEEDAKISSGEEHQDPVKQLKLAIKLDPNEPSYYEKLADEWKLKSPEKEIEALRQALKLQSNSANAKRLEQIVLRNKFEITYGREDRKTEFLKSLPTVTPIAIEVAADLISCIEDATTSRLKREFQEPLDQMRNRIFKRYGVKIPSIRFRGNETDLPTGTYIIMLNEIPLVSATIDPQKRLFPGTSAELDSMDVTGDEIVSPMNGQPAFWIKADDWSRIEEGGYALWEFLEYPIRHLESVLIKNLRMFVGHQEVMNMIEEQSPDYAERLKRNPIALGTLTQVVGSLLDEQVPIVELDILMPEFFDKWERGLGVWQIREALRSVLEIRPTLFGNNSDYVFIQLGSSFESLFEKSMHMVDGCPILDMGPTDVQNALTAVRERGTAGECLLEALVVGNSAIRPLVRELVQLEFPEIPVLSKSEVLPHLECRIRGKIDLS